MNARRDTAGLRWRVLAAVSTFALVAIVVVIATGTSQSGRSPRTATGVDAPGATVSTVTSHSSSGSSATGASGSSDAGGGSAAGGSAAGGPAAKPTAAGSESERPGPARVTVAEVRDPEEASSFPVSPRVRARYRKARLPSRAATAFVAPGALSTAQVRKDLAQERALQKAEQTSQETVPGGDSVGGNGTIPIPPAVPPAVQAVIAGANAITDLPYVYGGGHLSFVDNAYDCSGSISYALAAAGLLSVPETSGQLESWGAPGPGKWITIYASGGHVYMYVNIGNAWMRYDTVGRSGPFASRWQPDSRSNEGFVARHWPGL